MVVRWDRRGRNGGAAVRPSFPHFPQQYGSTSSFASPPLSPPPVATSPTPSSTPSTNPPSSFPSFPTENAGSVPHQPAASSYVVGDPSNPVSPPSLPRHPKRSTRPSSRPPRPSHPSQASRLALPSSTPSSTPSPAPSSSQPRQPRRSLGPLGPHEPQSHEPYRSHSTPSRPDPPSDPDHHPPHREEWGFHQRPTTWSQKLIFAAPQFSSGCIEIFFDYWLYPFYASNLDISVPVLSFSLVLWGALQLYVAPWIGSLVDSLNVRCGRRRPILVISTILMAAAWMFLLAPSEPKHQSPDSDPAPGFLQSNILGGQAPATSGSKTTVASTSVCIMFCVRVTLWQLTRLIQDTTYSAWTVEYTLNSSDRDSLYSLQRWFWKAGGVVGAGFAPFYVNWLGKDKFRAYRWFGLGSSMLLVLMYLSMAFVCKERGTLVDRSVPDHPVLSVISSWYNSPFRIQMIVFMIWRAIPLIPFVPQNNVLFHITSERVQGAGMIVLLVVAMVALPVWLFLARRFRLEKAQVFCISVLFDMGLPGILLASTPSLPDYLLPYLFFAYTSMVSMSVRVTFEESMLADTVEVDHMYSGLRREGQYSAIKSMLLDSVSLLSSSLGWSILGAAGYNAKVDFRGQSSNVVTTVRFVALVPTVVMVALILVMRNTKLSRKTHALVVAAIQRHQQGLPAKDPLTGELIMPPVRGSQAGLRWKCLSLTNGHQVPPMSAEPCRLCWDWEYEEDLAAGRRHLAINDVLGSQASSEKPASSNVLAMLLDNHHTQQPGVGPDGAAGVGIGIGYQRSRHAHSSSLRNVSLERRASDSDLLTMSFPTSSTQELNFPAHRGGTSAPTSQFYAEAPFLAATSVDAADICEPVSVQVGHQESLQSPGRRHSGTSYEWFGLSPHDVRQVQLSLVPDPPSRFDHAAQFSDPGLVRPLLTDEEEEAGLLASNRSAFGAGGSYGRSCSCSGGSGCGGVGSLGSTSGLLHLPRRGSNSSLDPSPGSCAHTLTSMFPRPPSSSSIASGGIAAPSTAPAAAAASASGSAGAAAGTFGGVGEPPCPRSDFFSNSNASVASAAAARAISSRKTTPVPNRPSQRQPRGAPLAYLWHYERRIYRFRGRTCLQVFLGLKALLLILIAAMFLAWSCQYKNGWHTDSSKPFRYLPLGCFALASWWIFFQIARIISIRTLPNHVPPHIAARRR